VRAARLLNKAGVSQAKSVGGLGHALAARQDRAARAPRRAAASSPIAATACSRPRTSRRPRLAARPDADAVHQARAAPDPVRLDAVPACYGVAACPGGGQPLRKWNVNGSSRGIHAVPVLQRKLNRTGMAPQVMPVPAPIPVVHA
jgi:hypothetical protein